MSNKYQDKKNNDNEKKLIKEQLREQYRPEWMPCEQVLAPNNSIREYLGDSDADIEWSNDSKGACEKFLNIDAYRRFIENENIILVGRTGTGKSSILNRYKYAVDNNEIKEFKIAVIINFQRFFDKLVMCNFEDERNSIYYIKDAIELVVKLHLVSKIVKYKEEDKAYDGILKDVLNKLRIRKKSNIIKRIWDDLDVIIKSSDKLGDVVRQLNKWYKEIMSDEVDEAIHNFLQSKKILVLIDSLDYYDVVERKIVTVNRALVELAFEYYKNLKDNRILLKVAMPSEVYKHILETIVAKQKGKIVTIEWRYKDIVKMLAIKIFHYFKKENYNFATNFIEDYNIEDFYNYETAYAFLYTLLPEKCPACIPLHFETIPYCIRHTQKKPRQILQIFNALIGKICDEKQFLFFKYNDILIRDYVHIAQYNIIEDALSMYNQTARNSLLPIVKSALHKKRNFMNAKEFSEAVKEAFKIYGTIGLDNDEIEQILIESGLIGQVHEEHFIKENNQVFQNESVNKISIVYFEYQRKDTLPRKSDAIYVLHPMCYEYYENEIDNNALVYPAPADDFDDNIIQKLERENIIY